MSITIGNPELLKVAIKIIDADLSHWDQGRWVTGRRSEETFEVNEPGWFFSDPLRVIPTDACGTTMCLAGHVAALEGYKLSAEGFGHNPLTGHVEMIHVVARDALGLSDDQARQLFIESVGMQDIQEFKRHVTEVTGVTFE